MTPIEKVLELAESWVGYLEKSKTEYKKDPSIVYEKTAGAGRDNYTMTWEDTRPAFQGQAWCMNFIYWLFYKCFGVDNARQILYLNSWDSSDSWNNFACFSWAENFQNHGARYQSSKAKVGDLIFFSKSHVGIVCDIKDGRVYTIEGNTSAASGVISNGGGIAKKSYVLGSDEIYCYGRPNWGVAIMEIERPVIRKGYKDSEQGGTYCRILQEALNELGITDDNGDRLTVDGSCGGKTVQAIMRFQTAARQSGDYAGAIDGICGNGTWKAVDSAVDKLSGTVLVNCDIIIKKGSRVSVGDRTGNYAYLTEYDMYVPISMLN